MEAFAFLKFWKSNNAKVSAGTADETAGDSYDLSEFSDDDSFFELELTLPNYDAKFPNPDLRTKSNGKPSSKSKPQSPMSKLRFFVFRKLKKSKLEDEFETETESVSSSSSSSIFGPKRNDFDLFTVKFKIEDGSIVPKFTRDDSLSRSSVDECYDSSKRFSIDVVQKYLNRIKPTTANSPARLSASFSSKKFTSKRKQLRKSKSASEMIVVSSPANFPARNEHPHDGIESAILHCKLSLNSSKGYSSSLSRCSSDPSHEKSEKI